MSANTRVRQFRKHPVAADVVEVAVGVDDNIHVLRVHAGVFDESENVLSRRRNGRIHNRELLALDDVGRDEPGEFLPARQLDLELWPEGVNVRGNEHRLSGHEKAYPQAATRRNNLAAPGARIGPGSAGLDKRRDASQLRAGSMTQRRVAFQLMTEPPFTEMVCPVMKSESGLNRKTIVPIMSSGTSRRWMARDLLIISSCSGCSCRSLA